MVIDIVRNFSKKMRLKNPSH